MKFSKIQIWYIVGAVAVIGGGFSVYWFFFRKKSNVSNVPVSDASGGGGAASSLPINSFVINDRYYLNGTPTVYASVLDAYDKTLEDSGFGNRLTTIYADSLASGFVAYTSENRISTYPQGIYYYPAQNLAFTVNASGVITVVFDEEKPTNLTSNTVTTGTI